MSLPTDFRNAYEVLGLRQGATVQEIKDQYKLLAKRHHPDLCPPGQRAAAEAYFKEVTQAYTRLTARGAGHLQAASEWHARYAETAATGRSGHSAGGGEQYYARYARAGAKAAPKFSSGLIASILALPLLLSGIHLTRAYNNLANDPWRPGGVLSPPENPWLRDDLRPRTLEHRRGGLWRQWLGESGGLQRKNKAAADQQQQQQQGSRGAGAAEQQHAAA